MDKVVIVGGGPVGLSAAICLAKQGVKSILIEKHPSTTEHPKARGVNGRTMELFRSWGLEDQMKQYRMPKEANGFALHSVRDDSHDYLKYNQEIVEKLKHLEKDESSIGIFTMTELADAIEGYQTIVKALEEGELRVVRFVVKKGT